MRLIKRIRKFFFRKILINNFIKEIDHVFHLIFSDKILHFINDTTFSMLSALVASESPKIHIKTKKNNLKCYDLLNLNTTNQFSMYILLKFKIFFKL